MSRVRCKLCSKEFPVKPSQIAYGWGLYCSKDCQHKSQQKGKTVKCFQCKSYIYRSPKQLNRSKSEKFFCSKSCQTIWRNIYYSEHKSYSWIDGKRAYRSILRRSGKKMTCEVCGNNDIRVLIVHHKDQNRSNNDVSNLTWLCCNCHQLVHHKYIKI